jgi:peroxiredoxin
MLNYIQEASQVKPTLRYILFIVGFLLIANTWAEFKDFNGTPHKLADFTGKGKWTVVMFWASDCRVCNAEIGQYIRFNDKHKNQDASILGVSLDGQSGLKAAQDFVQRHAVTFPNLVGEPNAVAELYQNLTGNEWLGTPSFLVYNTQGELMAAQAGAVPPDLIEKFIKENSQVANKPQ